MTEFSPAWSRRRLWVFRTGVALLLVQLLSSLLDASPETRALAERLQGLARVPFVALVPRLVDRIVELSGRSDGHAVALELVRDGLLSVALAALWTALDRRRAHDRLAGAVRVFLRYLTGCLLAVYGGLKVVPVQFPEPSAEQLLTPLGEFTPMGLLWVFVGASPAYSIFGGLAELAGAALLFWRRTTTLGALLLVGVMSHVTVLNFAYDVPVKHAATLLLLASVVLASRDARALLDLFVHARAVRSSPEPAFSGGPGARRVRALLKPLIVTGALLGPITIALALAPRPSVPPLQGIYSVERYSLHGSEVPAALSEPARWRRLVLDDRGDAVVQHMDGRCERFELAIDTTAHTLTLAQASSELRFDYEEDGAQATWIGTGSAPTLTLRREDPARLFRVTQ